MRKSRHHTTFSAILTCVMMVAFVWSALGQARSHGPLDYRQVFLSAVQGSESSLAAHGHSHDTEDDTASKTPSHPKSHNPSDHTHDVPADPGRVEVSLHVFEDYWRLNCCSSIATNDSDRLERPPRA